MGLPDSQNATYAGNFVLAGIAWLVGLFFVVDVIVARVFNSRILQSRILISHKLYLSWYLYLLGAAAITFGFMHRFWVVGDDVGTVHTVGCICLGGAAASLLLVAPNFFYAERNTSEKVIVEAQHRTTDEIVPLASPHEEVDESIYRRVVRTALPHEVAPDDPESPLAFRWVIGPVAAHLPFTVLALLVFIVHTLVAVIVSSDRSRDGIAILVWGVCSLACAVAVIAKVWYGRCRSNSHDPDRPSEDPYETTRMVHAVVIAVVCGLNILCVLVWIVSNGACDDEPVDAGCWLSGAFSFRALISLIAAVGAAILTVLPLWSTCTMPSSSKVAPDNGDFAMFGGESSKFGAMSGAFA